MSIPKSKCPFCENDADCKSFIYGNVIINCKLCGKFYAALDWSREDITTKMKQGKEVAKKINNEEQKRNKMVVWVSTTGDWIQKPIKELIDKDLVVKRNIEDL